MKTKTFSLLLVLAICALPTLQAVEKGEKEPDWRKSPTLAEFLKTKTWEDAKIFLTKETWEKFKAEGVPPEIIHIKMLSLSEEWKDWIRFKAQQRLEAKRGMGWSTMLFSSSATLTNLFWGGDRSGGKEFKQGWNAYWNPKLTKDDFLDITCDLCVEEGIVSEEEYWSIRSELGIAWDTYSFGTDVADLLGVIPEAASKPLSCAGFAVGIVLDAIEETEESWKNIEEDATIGAHDEWREKPEGGGYKLQQISDYYLAYQVRDKESTDRDEERFWRIYSQVETGDLEPKTLYSLGASGLAYLSASLPYTKPLPHIKYGWFTGDWDPEWEETWYWEGWEYPATDVAYERYGYVDEQGAYDWEKDDDIIYEDYSYP